MITGALQNKNREAQIKRPEGHKESHVTVMHNNVFIKGDTWWKQPISWNFVYCLGSLVLLHTYKLWNKSVHAFLREICISESSLHRLQLPNEQVSFGLLGRRLIWKLINIFMVYITFTQTRHICVWIWNVFLRRESFIYKSQKYIWESFSVLSLLMELNWPHTGRTIPSSSMSRLNLDFRESTFWKPKFLSLNSSQLWPR